MDAQQREARSLSLLDRYQQPIYWHLRRMLVRHEDAEDVLQETFVKIYQSLDQLRNVEAERAWVYRIATNEALRWIGRQHEELLSTEEVDAQLLESLTEGAYVDYDDGAGRLFQAAILSLPITQRTVFQLRYYDELSYEQIAQITDSRVETLKVNYHYAKQRIKAYIDQYG